MRGLLPNTTQIPNLIIDEWLPLLSDTEFRVLLIVCRQTLGWIEDTTTGRRKEKDWISYEQLITKTGRSREAIATALKSLREKHLIETYDQDGHLLSGEHRLSGRRQLFYRLVTYEANLEKKSEKLTFKSQESGHTKETLTKVLTLSNDSEPSSQTTHSPNGFSSLGAMARRKLAEIEAKKKNGEAKPGGLRHEFQFNGYRLWEKLRLPRARLSAYLKAAKDYPRAVCEAAYSFAADFSDPTKRDRMFWWKLHQLTGTLKEEAHAVVPSV